jgi:uncharacterized damage-inducible protein DinB
MNFSLSTSLEVLNNTSAVIFALLNNLSDDWTTNNEGPQTWSAKEVVAHLIVCEDTAWIPRVLVTLSDTEVRTFAPIDMNGHFQVAATRSLPELLATFKQKRDNSISALKKLHLREPDFLKTAIHAKLGEITLQQLLATWVAHDLTHIAQIARIMAMQQKENVGGFESFLSIFRRAGLNDN